MEITYDKKADVMYIYFQKGVKIARAVELADLLIADLDKKGKVIGVEVLAASNQIKNNKKTTKTKNIGLFNFSLPLPA
ncbi:MAG: hypothetical protein A3G47_02020 [Candidatus Zambryskibacteria bacterium RIFCSPLOWO2_12_FULL_39_45]|uniref:DUF2283 domain-containing protein n=1 Tax=Candidatus Zambryskibacteria bacterium RIFCSPLOWO2_12_39_8 TaxID=1802774 RepID=A0A1G2UWW0_9BACT|nr:MAG: hypothetical protein A3C63_01155 [Candidatus Zambryskibacteria bacterium RIFCSPHIGHO2_02_FULL_39_82]OHB07383.1 MAG: hypothetical protein A2W64_00485 [Candidatus Zambryskibacteria bacterium RIFCSPLOWO2_02_39_10]OHB13145.1 MAG: hypothetical protein A3G47_02020 [Candidatus Zambryskibacteria bacterium RIFCSPLOWO2_12_FULL_39_45]OHB13880.1 MAG: hypothetical protein A2Y49_02150 [Candidatus Zambryskibacteria bacterium RIFCSPLOWO2_12_39_8]